MFIHIGFIHALYGHLGKKKDALYGLCYWTQEVN